MMVQRRTMRRRTGQRGGRRAVMIRLCAGAMAFPVVVSALWPGVLGALPLRAALIILFNLGCVGMGAVGLIAALTGGQTHQESLDGHDLYEPRNDAR